MTATHVVDHIHDEPMSEVALRSVAIEALLAEKGLLTPEEVQRQVNLMDGRTPADGARVVAKAWVDEGFKARLLADSRSALAEMGIEIPAETPLLEVVENTEDVHHLVVCTLVFLLSPDAAGPPARLVQEPGLSLPGRQRPAGSDGRVRNRVGRRRPDHRVGQHRRHALPGAAAPAGGNRGDERGRTGQPGKPGQHDWGHGRTVAVAGAPGASDLGVPAMPGVAGTV